MTAELIKGVVLLLALCLLHSFNIRATRGNDRLRQLTSGLLFGGVAILGLSQAVVVVPGVLFDVRSVVLGMAGLFGGPVVGLIAGTMAALYRLHLGGGGTDVGLAIVAASVLLGLAYRHLAERGIVRSGWWQLLMFGLLLHVVEGLLFSLLPGNVAPQVLATVVWPMALVYTPATLLLGLMLKDAQLRVDMELELVTKEARLRATLKAIPDFLFVVNEDGKFVEVLSGASNESDTVAHMQVGKNLKEVLSPADAERLVQTVAKTLRWKETQAVEYELKTSDGLRVFDCRMHALSELIGGRKAVVLLARDITEHSVAQKSLQESEARFRSLLQDVPSVAVQGYRPDGTISYWNKTSERLFGFAADEAVGRNVVDLIVPHPMRQAVSEVLQHMHHSATAAPPQELTLVNKNGKEVPVLSSHAVVPHKNGELEFFRFDIDLAERKRTEAELRIAATAFEAQEGMLVTNARREILRVNQAFVRISGYNEEEVLGKTPSMFSSGWHDNSFYSEMNQQLDVDGKWEGEIWNRRKNGEVFPEWLHVTAVRDEAQVVSHYVATITDITQRKAAEDQIRQLAFYDPLTGLPNRRMLMDRLQHALAASARSDNCGALLFIDLDHFKTLNDTLGHDKGDLLLQQVAHRLIDTVREEDTVARLGGDEYVVMLEGLDIVRDVAAAQATAVGDKIIAALNMPYKLAGHDFHSTPSMGLALFHGHEVGIDELLKQADLAMYQAKNAGRNGLRFFDPLMQAAVSQRANLEADIRHGILYGQFLLYYQPQVDVSGRVLGAEALLRWQHPERGMVSPASFIPIAEETGQILTLGSWVLETACAQLVRWAADPQTEHLTLAVNVSARQFRQQDFADHIFGLLDYTGANPKRLKLELTESLLAENLEDVILKMDSLRVRGVGFSLDDFGTGYSSLTYLKRLPLDQLKIDQSFVRDVLSDPNDAVIAKTIVALGNSLGLNVIAEGVETLQQRDFLQGSGCTTYQGYLFSRPLAADAFDAFVHQATAALEATAIATH